MFDARGLYTMLPGMRAHRAGAPRHQRSWTLLFATWLAIAGLLVQVMCDSSTRSSHLNHTLLAQDDGNRPADAPPEARIPDLIDVLAQSEQHTILLRLLQRSRLIPTLLMLQELGDGRGLTLFAPTDDAIMQKAKVEGDERKGAHSGDIKPSYVEWDIAPRTLWEWAVFLASKEGDAHSPDSDEDLVMPVWYADATRLNNINAVLRQQLLYHMINYTLPYNFTADGQLDSSAGDTLVPLPEAGRAAMLETLHLPSRRLLHEPTRPGPIPQPPREGSEDIGGLLGGEGQKLRIARADEKGKRITLGTNARGEGGVRVIAANQTSPKGIMLSIDGILDLPPSFDTVLKTHPELQYLLNITSERAMHSLSQSAHATFLLPKSDAFDSLSPIEREYLQGSWPLARQDRLKMFGQHMSGIGMGSGKVAYANRLRDEGLYNLTTIFGGDLPVNASAQGAMKIGDASVIQEDILTENGVIHIVDRLLLPYNDLGLSVEKTLLALNATKWVEMMHAEGLSSYIDASPHGNDDPDEKVEPWTFLVPRDDVIKTWLEDRERDKIAKGRYDRWYGNQDSLRASHDADDSLEHKTVDVLLYHIAPDMLQPQNLSDGMLVGTELRGWRLKDARQRVLVGVDDEGDRADKDRQGNGDVGFGDANVIATPVKVGPSIIYLISQILQPPSNPIQTAVSSLSLSTFVATVFSAELDTPIKRAPAITYLVPNNDAFNALGLAMPYLLLDQAQPRGELRSVVEYHAIDRIVYTEDFASGSQRYPTLEGSSIWAGRDENGTIEVRRGTEGRNARIIKGDMLTSTGVLHAIDQVELPPTLDLTIEKLMKGAKAETMRDLVHQAGYGWIINGSMPTDEQFEMLVSGKFPDGKKGKRDRKRHKHRHELLQNREQAYTILCPTDSAFTHVNLTYYYENRDALRDLVQMHIIPSPAGQTPMPDGGGVKKLPLGILDESKFSTLLDTSVGGMSKYGKIVFRKLAPAVDQPVDRLTSNVFGAAREEEPNLGWMVGVADTRGTDGRKFSARLLNFGRESLALETNDDDDDKKGDFDILKKKRRSRRNPEGSPLPPQSIGGILTIDAVLHPYTPNWFYRWGYIVLLSFTLAGMLAGGGYGLWRWWHRDGRIRLSEAMDGEEE